LFGQSKYCHTAIAVKVIVPCYLTPIKNVDDTFITIMPKECNEVHFDSTSNGQWKIYSADTTTIIEIAGFKNGQRHGTDIKYYSQGKIESKSEYTNGQLNGNYISFFETGKIYMKGYYKIRFDNFTLFTGTYTEYWDNGNIAHIYTQEDGSYGHKNEIYLDKDGKKINEKKFNKLWYNCK
jgi:antitoxin component YwqK of YwqJK toxin-antitoxin module